MSRELDDENVLSQDAAGDPGLAPDTDQMLVNMLNEMEAYGFAFDLTLIVQGFLISGVPIFLDEYLERQGAFIERATRERASLEHDPEIARNVLLFGEAIQARYHREAEFFKLPEAPEGDAEARARRDAVQDEILATPRKNLMLKRVTMLSPSGEQLDVPFWRGRLSHVAGWLVGRSEQHGYSGIDPDADQH